MSSATILVVDDESGIRSTINEILTDEGYAVATAADGAQARLLYAERSPDLVLLDVWMPDIDGITLLQSWSEGGRLKCPVVVMSGHGTVETAVEATRLGAVDYIEKPLSLSQLLRTVETALGRTAAADPVRAPALDLADMPQGRGEAIRAAREQAEQIAARPGPVLIVGETGTEREQFARYVHAQSPRATLPFVAIGGGTLTQEFGTDLLAGSGQGPGLLQQAEGGTLYIGELEHVSPAVQSFLLGLLDQGGYIRPGQNTPYPANARLMVSVESDSPADVRADLLASLGVSRLTVPPLRDYREDVPRLLGYYVDRCVESGRFPYRRFSVAAQNRLRNYPWPGNLRELRALVHRLLTAGGDEEIGTRECEASLQPVVRPARTLVTEDVLALPLRAAREQFERIYLERQLALCNGKVGRLADRVGMERTHLYRKLRSLGIDFGQGGPDA